MYLGSSVATRRSNRVICMQESCKPVIVSAFNRMKLGKRRGVFCVNVETLETVENIIICVGINLQYIFIFSDKFPLFYISPATFT